LLQRWYRLSDPGLEEAVKDRKEEEIDMPLLLHILTILMQPGSKKVKSVYYGYKAHISVDANLYQKKYLEQ